MHLFNSSFLTCCACKAPHFVILQLELVLNFDFYLLLFPSTARQKLSYFNTKFSNWRLSFKCSWIPVFLSVHESHMTLHIANITSILICHLNIDYYMLIPISALISSRDFDICPRCQPRADMGRVMISGQIGQIWEWACNKVWSMKSEVWSQKSEVWRYLSLSVLSWFRVNLSLLSFLNDVCRAKKQKILIL